MLCSDAYGTRQARITVWMTSTYGLSVGGREPDRREKLWRTSSYSRFLAEIREMREKQNRLLRNTELEQV